MKTKKLKKALTSLLILAMLVSLFASAVFADTVPDNPEGTTVDIVPAGDTMEVNNGTVRENEGTIADNARTENGPAVVITNTDTGTVERNDGVIVTNDGTVGIAKENLPDAGDNAGPPSVGNFGTIETNNGTVEFNQGNIGTRDESGNPIDLQGNFGEVEVNAAPATVTINHEDATINNNRGTVIENDGEVGDNYGSVRVNNDVVTNNLQDHMTGTIGVNNGFVENNESVIKTNARTENGPAVVETNAESGTVERNDGVIVTNDGIVGIAKEDLPDAGDNAGPPSVGNFGTIETNNGTVEFNKGNIGTMNENGVPNEDQGNFGTVVTNGSGTVTINQKDATIDDNHGTVIDNEGTIGKNYQTIVENNGEVSLNGQQIFEDGRGNIGTIETNNRTVETNESIIAENTEEGVVKDNAESGAVKVNDGTVEANEGTVEENLGTVETNTGTVALNEGTVEENAGTVETNEDLVGKIENDEPVGGNTGTVTVNASTGVVINEDGGTVTTNNGEVYNYGGTVTNNVGTEYFSVEIVNETTYTVSEDNGLKSAYNQQWLGQTGSTVSTATVTLTPKAGYEIASITGLGDNVSAVKNDDGTWTLTITSGKNTSIAVPESTEIKNEEPENSNTGDDNTTPASSDDSGSTTPVVPSEEGSTTPVAPSVPVTQEDNYAVITFDNGESVVYNFDTATPNAADTEAVIADTPAAEDNGPVVIGTDAATESAIVRTVDSVLTVGTENNAAFEAAIDSTSETYNAEFAAAAESVLTIGGGTVDFGDAFVNAEEATINVPVTVPGAQAGQEYTVVLSNGETITVTCDANGQLIIPFPKDATNLSYVIQDDFASRYATLIENYLQYGEQALAGRSPETRARVIAYAEELNRAN